MGGRPVTADDLGHVRAVLDEADACAAHGRSLLDRSMTLRTGAFDALPDGVRLLFAYPPPGQVFAVGLRDGVWVVSSDGAPVETEWVREQWVRGNWTIVAD